MSFWTNETFIIQKLDIHIKQNKQTHEEIFNDIMTDFWVTLEGVFIRL